MLLAASLSAQAQAYSIGGKTGLNSFVSIGNGMRATDMEPKGGYLTNVTGTLMGRYAGKKKWGLEAALSYAVLNQSETPNYWSAKTYFMVTDYYMVDLSAQYELSCGNWAQNNLLKRLHIYVGAGISVALAAETYSYTEYLPEARNVIQGRGTSVGGMLLLTQMASYRLNKEFSFLVSSELKTMPWQWNGYLQRNSMSSAQLGLLYHMH